MPKILLVDTQCQQIWTGFGMDRLIVKDGNGTRVMSKQESVEMCEKLLELANEWDDDNPHEERTPDHIRRAIVTVMNA